MTKGIYDDELLRAVEVGMGAYHRLPIDENPNVPRRGGTVVAVTDDIDAETGEISRAFITATRKGGRIRFDRLRADDVDPGRLEPMNPASVRGMSRALAEQYSRGRGMLTKDDIDLIERACVLARCVG